MDAYSFLQQQRTFAVHGYALNPSALSAQSSKAFVGDTSTAAENGYALIHNLKGTQAERKANKRKREAGGDASIVSGEGSYKGPWAGWEGDRDVDPEVEEEAEEWRAEKKRREEASAAAKEKMKRAGEEKSVFHGMFGIERIRGRARSELNDDVIYFAGKSLTDYAGRTYMHIPTDVDVTLNPAEDAAPPESFIPSQCVHTWVS